MSFPLSFTGKKWILKRQESTPDIVSVLRSERQIIDDPTSKLSDPFLFPEMEKAVARIKRAIEANETIGIFGDYDADGITGTAQLVRYFRRHSANIVVHLPDRAKEGYGMKVDSVEKMKKNGVSLLITVDTGISAHAEIAHAATRGVDVIVTDHHRPQGGRPAAYAVIHPLVPTAFPNEHLSGSGVAFMLIRALEGLQPWNGIDTDIALASIGTIGDLVPLTGENRTLVIHGLKFIANLPPSPLRDLIDSVKGNGPLTAGDVAFRVVPRINAAGRMSHPDIALRALLDGGRALEELHQLNGDRRTFVDELDEMLSPESASDAFLVLGSTAATPGTAGLLASRLTERFGRPSLVAAISGENAVASIRSVPGIDVMDALSHAAVRPLLKTFGGHAQAAGCTFAAADETKLRAALNAVLQERGIVAADLVPVLELDAPLAAEHVTARLAKSIDTLSPFGQGNEEPMFLLPNQRLSDLRTVGAENAHLQARVGDAKAIGFRLGSLIDRLSSHANVDLACRIGINTWNGRESVQLVVEDIRKAV